MGGRKVWDAGGDDAGGDGAEGEGGIFPAFACALVDAGATVEGDGGGFAVLGCGV